MAAGRRTLPSPGGPLWLSAAEPIFSNLRQAYARIFSSEVIALPTAKPTYHWRAYLAEFLGTAILVFLGLGAVIFDFGPGSPVAALMPDPFLRRLLTGFLFGSVGALVALSPLGRESGAHLDPVLSWAFWLAGSLQLRDAVLYTLAQALGAILGALPLPIVWGGFGAAVRYGATLPGAWGSVVAILGEAAATFALVGGILAFVGRARLRPYTPALIPPLVALLVAFEAPLSGTSMNPARTLGPALVSNSLGYLWVYLVGPAAGALIAAIVVARPSGVHVAKIAHHEHDPLERFHGSARGSVAAEVQRRSAAIVRKERG